MREVYWDVSRRQLYLILLFAMAGVLLYFPLPIAPTYFSRTLENAGHMPLFFLVTLGVMFVCRDDPRLAGARLYVAAALIGVGSGFLSEVIQMPLARDASWEDVGADALGTICALGVFALFDRRSKQPRWRRLGALVVVCACLAIFVLPIVRMARAYVHRNGQFPVLADFHSRIELYWTVSFGVNRTVVDDALVVELIADSFPGVSFHEPVPDWRGYKTLLIDVDNPDSLPLNLGVRVHDDKHRRAFNDRFNRRFELAPGERRTLSIRLEDIRHGPKDRLMDMANISDITLFRGATTGSRLLRVYSMRLQ